MRRILLVDPEISDSQFLTSSFFPTGFQCEVKNSSTEAMCYLQENPVDLVVMEVMLPGEDGWEECKKLKASWRIPLIILSKKNQQKDIVRGLRLGADDYITKPYDNEELLARIQVLLR